MPLENKMVDFLFISTNDWTPWGGSEVLWSEVAKNLVKKDKKVVVYAKKWTELPKQVTCLESEGCILNFREKRFNRELKSIHHFINNRFSFFKFKLFRQIDLYTDFIEKNRPRILVLSLGNNNEGSPWVDIALKLKIPYILIVQLVQEGVVYPDKDQQRIKTYYTLAYKVFFVSLQNKKIMQKYCTDELNNSETILNPFPKITPLHFPNIEDEINLAFVASLSSNHKGHDILFEVLSTQKWRDRKLIINIYGEGPHSNYVRELVDFYALKNIKFHGYVSDKNEVWKINHGLILPSRMEGMSLALLEAIAYERIIITTNVGGANEVIKNYETGFIADFPCVESLDKILELAWSKRSNWQEMAKNSKLLFLNQYPYDPIENLSSNLIALLKS